MSNSATEKFNKNRSYLDSKIKICGMKHTENCIAVASLLPDYMGFIFYEKSPRFFSGIMPLISSSIKKTGVFVDQTIEGISEKITYYNLQAVQLHGLESPEFCQELRDYIGTTIEIIKAFSIDSEFNFQQTKLYEVSCTYYLFDTKGKSPGGNGKKFDWSILSDYKGSIPFFLSGGIGYDDFEDVRNIFQKNTLLYGVDYNSKLESQAGIKNIESVRAVVGQFKTQIK